jgi:hypothetical protein
LTSHLPSVTQNSFNNEGKSDAENCVSDQSSDIEEESKFRKFTQTLQMAQVVALKKENKNKRGKYSKQSKKTLKHHTQS